MWDATESLGVIPGRMLRATDRARRLFTNLADPVISATWTSRNAIRPSIWEVNAQVIPSRNVIRGLALIIHPQLFAYLYIPQIVHTSTYGGRPPLTANLADRQGQNEQSLNYGPFGSRHVRSTTSVSKQCPAAAILRTSPTSLAPIPHQEVR